MTGRESLFAGAEDMHDPCSAYREFWGENDWCRSTSLAITYTAEEAEIVWDALRRCRAYVEERTHDPEIYKGKFIRSYFEEETPQIKWASDLEREGIVP